MKYALLGGASIGSALAGGFMLYLTTVAKANGGVVVVTVNRFGEWEYWGDALVSTMFIVIGAVCLYCLVKGRSKQWG